MPRDLYLRNMLSSRQNASFTKKEEFVESAVNRGTLEMIILFISSDAYSSIYFINLKNLKEEKKLLHEKA